MLTIPKMCIAKDTIHLHDTKRMPLNVKDIVECEAEIPQQQEDIDIGLVTPEIVAMHCQLHDEEPDPFRQKPPATVQHLPLEPFYVDFHDVYRSIWQQVSKAIERCRASRLDTNLTDVRVQFLIEMGPRKHGTGSGEAREPDLGWPVNVSERVIKNADTIPIRLQSLLETGTSLVDRFEADHRYVRVRT